MNQLRKRLNNIAIKEILDCFVILTGIRVCYTDTEEVGILGVDLKMCSFCEAIRKYKQFDEACKACDLHAFKTAEASKSTYLYTCHMGLWEVVVPLYIKNHPAGFLMLGQVREQLDEEYWGSLQKQFDTFEISNDEINNIRKMYDGMPRFSRKQIEASANMLELMAKHMINTEMIDIYTSQKVEKVKKFIELHYLEQISTHALSAELKISKNTLCNAFKNETGKTITEYVNELRTNAAKDLLKSSDLTIKEISARLGYTDQNYFSRQFKKNSGVSPIKFRQNLL